MLVFLAFNLLTRYLVENMVDRIGCKGSQQSKSSHSTRRNEDLVRIISLNLSSLLSQHVVLILELLTCTTKKHQAMLNPTPNYLRLAIL